MLLNHAGQTAAVHLHAAEVGSYRCRLGAGGRDCRRADYKGRRTITKILTRNDELREMIIDQWPIRHSKDVARANGTRSLHEAALKLVAHGETTLAGIKRVTLHA